MTVRLMGRRGLPRVDRRRLRRRAGAILRAIDRADAELSVALVDDAAIADLNER
jgi:ssRNA-specific RNase YbeY (16S rRNA maturation enzyme)